MKTLLAVKGIENTTRPFRAKLVAIADELGLNPDYLAAVISFETAGTFAPDIKNFAGSGAVGLIQFRPTTANHLDTTTEKLAKMTATKQLDYVAAYYQAVGPHRINTALDHYLAVFSPAYIGSNKATPMYKQGTKAYQQNKGLDVDQDGVITVGDVSQTFLGVIANAEALPRVMVDEYDAPSFRGVMSGMSIALLLVGIYTFSKLSYVTHQRAIS